jgi:hypothetical protein
LAAGVLLGAKDRKVASPRRPTVAEAELHSYLA